VHTLVTNASNTYIPNERFDEYFGRLSAIVRLFKLFHADFNLINAYGHRPLSELEHESFSGYI
jgi:hypothetical protein